VLKKRLWRGVMGLLTILALLSLLLPQVRIVVWEGEQQRLLYLWGGHGALGSDVSGVAYILAALMGIIAALLMIGGFRDLQKENPRAIARFNWAALFLAIELVFLLGIAEEVLTDLRVQHLYADSYASWGGGIAEFLLFALLFVPGWVKKAYFPKVESSDA
jgi:hypothetical protein